MSLSDELDAAFQAYLDKVGKIAEREFKNKIKPVLDKKGVKLLVSPSWGEWWMEYDGEKVNSYDDPPSPLLREAFNILNTEVPGDPNSCFGAFMESYKPNQK